MELSNFILGFAIKQNQFETLGGARSALSCADDDSLIVFPHDLKAFAIPAEHVSCLAELYQRYLIASRILDCSVETSESWNDEEQLFYDQTTLLLIHGVLKVPFKNNTFNLDAAINFVEQESGFTRTLAIRWCMMMEYITHEDQRMGKLRKRNVECKNTEVAGGVDNG